MPDILTRLRFEPNVTTFDHRDASWPSPACRGDARAGTKRCSAVAARAAWFATSRSGLHPL